LKPFVHVKLMPIRTYAPIEAATVANETSTSLLYIQ
jgi:hypothetical protein